MRPGRAVAEIGAVLLLAVTGLVAGALAPWLALGPILGMALPLTAATVFLHREGSGWRALGFRRMPLGRFLALTLGTFFAILLVNRFVLAPLLRALGAPPIEAAPLVEAIEGNLTNYLVFLIPVAWGSAAFGEELLVRGFLLHRFEGLTGTRWAVVLQAGLFSLGHAYQGITGVVTLFVVGVILGVAYLRSGRNFWPVIATHGLIDTLSITLIYLGYADMPGTASIR